MAESIPARSSHWRWALSVSAIALVALALGASMLGSPMSRLEVDAVGIEAVRAPDRVEAYRLGAPPGESPPIGPTSPLEFPITAGPIDVPPALARALSDALLHRDWSLGLIRTECGPPLYGVKLAFHRTSEQTDVYVCFRCSELAVFAMGRRSESHSSRRTREKRWFRPRRFFFRMMTRFSSCPAGVSMRDAVIDGRRRPCGA